MNIHIISGEFYKVLFQTETHVFVQDSFNNRRKFTLAYFNANARSVESVSPKINKPPPINWEEAFEPETNT